MKFQIAHERPFQHELSPFLKRFAVRLRLCDSWFGMQSTLWMAGAAALLAQILGRLLPIPYLLVWTLLPLAIWLVFWVGWGLLKPMKPLKVARRVDLELDLKERLSSSYALAGGATVRVAGTKRDTQEMGKSDFIPSLVEDLHRDALQAAQKVDVRKDFPFAWSRRPLILAGILLIAICVMGFLPNPMDAVLAQRAAAKKAAEEQAAKIEEMMEKIEESEELTPEEREELLKKLQELAEQLKNNNGDLEKALADLARVEQELSEKLDPNYGLKQAALDAMLAQLKDLAQQNGLTTTEDSEMTALLEDLLEQLEEMDPSEQEALAQALAQMSGQASQSGNSALAEALSDLAQAVQSGDAKSVDSAAKAASQALSDARQAAASQAAMAQALSKLQASSQALSNAAAQANAGSPGQGMNPGNLPGSGMGAKVDTLPPNTGSGQLSKPPQGDPSAQTSSNSNQTGEAYQQQGTQGQQLYIPGVDTGQGEYQEKEKENPQGGLDNPSLIPYQDVYGDYLNTASQAIEKSYIPLGLKDYVRNYFTQLEPQTTSGE